MYNSLHLVITRRNNIIYIEDLVLKSVLKLKCLLYQIDVFQTTLRQQGLVNSYKAARQGAKDAQLSNSSEVRHSSSSTKVPQHTKLPPPSRSLSSPAIRKKDSNLSLGDQSTPAVADTSMEDLLKDLVVMTESILDDSG